MPRRATTHSFLPGDATWVPSDSPTTSFSAVFEDDGETGYFYAYDRARGEDAILDAMHIYNVRNVVDREIPSTVEIVWTGDGLGAALLINGRGHAVIDFGRRLGYCRSNFPPPGGPWRADAREPWHDGLLAPFLDEGGG